MTTVNDILFGSLLGSGGGGGKNGIVKLICDAPYAVLRPDGSTRVHCAFSAEVTGDYAIQEHGLLYSNNGSQTSADFTIEDVDGTNINLTENYYGANVRAHDTPVYARGYVKVNDQYIYTGNLGGSYADLKKPVLIEKTVSANGTYTAADDGADGFSTVTVDIPKDKVELSILSICFNSKGIGQVRAQASAAVPSDITIDEIGLILCTDAVANTTELTLENVGVGDPPVQKGGKTDGSVTYVAGIGDKNGNGVKFRGYMIASSENNKVIMYAQTITAKFAELLAPTIISATAEGTSAIRFTYELSSTPREDSEGRTFDIDENGLLIYDEGTVSDPITADTPNVQVIPDKDMRGIVILRDRGTGIYARPYARIGTDYYYGVQVFEENH